jgi:hypothetical protein
MVLFHGGRKGEQDVALLAPLLCSGGQRQPIEDGGEGGTRFSDRVDPPSWGSWPARPTVDATNTGTMPRPLAARQVGRTSVELKQNCRFVAGIVPSWPRSTGVPKLAKRRKSAVWDQLGSIGTLHLVAHGARAPSSVTYAAPSWEGWHRLLPSSGSSPSRPRRSRTTTTSLRRRPVALPSAPGSRSPGRSRTTSTWRSRVRSPRSPTACPL